MRTYIVNIPDDFDISTCKILFKNGKFIFDKQLSKNVNERIITDFLPIEEDEYWGKVHNRVAVCVEELRDNFGMGFISDSVGGIQALEVTVNDIVNRTMF